MGGIMGSIKMLSVSFACTLILAGCDANNVEQSSLTVIDTGNAQVVAASLKDVTMNGLPAERHNHSAPPASQVGVAPEVFAQNLAQQSRAGEYVTLEYSISSDLPVVAIYAQVVNSNLHYSRENLQTKEFSNHSISFLLPERLGDGRFCVDFAARDTSGSVGYARESSCISVVSIGTSPPSTVAPEPTVTVTPSVTPVPEPTSGASVTPTPTVSPTPVPTSPGEGIVVTEGDATACWEGNIRLEGYRRRETVRQTMTDTGDQHQTTAEWVVKGPATYRGMESLEIVIYPDNSVSDAENNITTLRSETHRYRVYDNEAFVTQVLGGWGETEYRHNAYEFQQYSYHEIEYDAPDYLLSRYDLEPGESYTTSTVWRQRSINRINDDPATENESPPIYVTQFTTYLGREIVTVPAGTFDTCRFDIVQEATIDGEVYTGELTLNVAVDYGFRVRNTSEGSISELISATVNGVPVN